MRYLLLEERKDVPLLLARIFLMVLFVIFGGQKLAGFSGAVGYMSSTGVPAPAFATVIAIVIEVVAGIAILVGFYTRPLALLMALYVLGTGFIGHHYWTMSGVEHAENMINFYKNVSITGGLLALCAAGPGRYSFDTK
jgi:putative oxidoreductase